MINKYYQDQKNIFLFVVSIILTLFGWGLSVATYKLFKPHSNQKLEVEFVPISLAVRLIYGLVSTILTNYYLDKEEEKIHNWTDFFNRYQYYIYFSTITILSGWYLTIYALLKWGYTTSVIFRIAYGILCTFITLRYIPKKNVD